MYMLGIPVALLSNIILARTLGPEAFGQYVFMMSLLSLLALPVAAGIPQLLTREVATYTHGGQWRLYHGAIRAAYLWVIGLSLLMLALYSTAGPLAGWLPVEGKWALLGIVILLVPLQGLNAVRNGTIKGLGFPAQAELPTQLIQPLLLLAAFAVLAALGVLNAEAALWLQVGVGALTFLIASLLFLRVRPLEARNMGVDYQSRTWLVALLPFGLITLVGSFNAQISIVLLGYLGTDEAVAALRIADRGAQFVVLSLALVNMVVSPYIVKIHRDGDKERLQQISRQTARGAFLISLFVCLILVLFGKVLIRLTFGEEYVKPAYIPMVIMSLGYLFSVGLGAAAPLLAMSGHENLMLRGQLTGLAAIAIGAVVLIPYFQAVGAAIAISIGQVVWNGSLGLCVYKRLKIRPGVF